MARKRQPSAAQVAMLRDLSEHASRKAHAAVRDACQLVDEVDFAYSVALHVIGSLICTAASNHPSKRTHAEKIAVVLTHLHELMAEHVEHGNRGF